VGALDEEAAIFLRVAGDENAEEAAVSQAASNYRAAVQRRNIAYDRACGIPEDQAGSATAAAPLGTDPAELRKMIDEAVAGRQPATPTIDETALQAAVDAALKTRLPEAVAAAVAKANAGDGGETRKPPASGSGSSSSSGKAGASS
jgi:hypothetical protein